MMQVTPFGACRMVTGSCHLVQDGSTRIVLDVGMFQGFEEDRNAADFGFDPKTVEAVVISHAHLDHVGRLPKLVREGFRGPIWMTPATATLLPIMLDDALHVMRWEQDSARRRGRDIPPPLWGDRDLKETLGLVETLPYGVTRTVGATGIALHDAGHLPGSALIEVTSAHGERLIYTGDIGHEGKHVLPPPARLPPADLVLCEATYGDRPHRSFEATLAEFQEVLSEVLSEGGQVLIPSFALERTQGVLYHLRRLQDSGALPTVPVFLDSPLAIRVTEVFRTLSESFTDEVRYAIQQGEDPFHPADLRYTSSVEASKAIAEHRGPAIIIAGSGMLAGGRVLHHLQRVLPSARSALVIIGYQPRGGLGARIVARESRVNVLGRRVPVRCRVETINGFSAHGGQDDLMDWLEGHRSVALVHGESQAIDALSARLRHRGQAVVAGAWGEPIVVDRGSQTP